MSLAVYNGFKNQWLDLFTYLTAGLAFVMMGIMKDGLFQEHRKILNVVSWVLTILAGILLLALFRNDP